SGGKKGLENDCSAAGFRPPYFGSWVVSGEGRHASRRLRRDPVWEQFQRHTDGDGLRAGRPAFRLSANRTTARDQERRAAATPFVSLTVDSSGERGLLGIAFDPNFGSNQFVYLYYTV